MSNKQQTLQPQAPAPMRPLTTEELREIVGGPVINNGGGGCVASGDPEIRNGDA